MLDPSTSRLRLREFPGAVQDLGARAIEPHGVIPALHDRQAVWNLAVTSAELDGDRSIGVLLARDAVDRISIVWGLFVIAFGIVEANGPEGIDRHILDRELVDGGAVVLCRGDIEIGRVLVRVAAPACGSSDQMAYRIDFGFGTECLPEVRYGCRKDQERVAHLLLAGLVPVWRLACTFCLLVDVVRAPQR